MRKLKLLKFRMFYKLLYYNFLQGFKNLYSYFFVVWNLNGCSYNDVLEMQMFQLTKLKKNMQRYNEIGEEEQKSIKNIDRCIELIQNKLNDNYRERCGYNYNDFQFSFIPIEGKKDLFEMKTSYKGIEDNPESGRIDKLAKELEKKEVGTAE